MPLSRRQKLANYEKELQEIAEQISALTTQISASSVPDVTANLIDKRREWTEKQAVLEPVTEALRAEIAAKDAETVEANTRIWREKEKPQATAEIRAAVAKCAEVFRPFLDAYAELIEVEERWKNAWAARGRPDRPAKTYAGGDVFQFMNVTPPGVRIRRRGSLFWQSVGPVLTGRERVLSRIDPAKRAGISIDEEELSAEQSEEVAEADSQAQEVPGTGEERQTDEPQEISGLREKYRGALQRDEEESE